MKKKIAIIVIGAAANTLIDIIKELGKKQEGQIMKKKIAIIVIGAVANTLIDIIEELGKKRDRS